MSHPRVAVVGAGVIGLSTATELQRKLPNAEVYIIADKFTTDTCSIGAAGLFRPGINFRGPTLEITTRCLSDSYNYYNNLLTNNPEEAKKAGIIRLSGYLLSTLSPDIVKNFFLETISKEFRVCSKSEIDSITSGHKFGSFCTTLLTQCRKYLPYLSQKFESNGGTFVKKHLSSFEQLCGEYDIVFNCSGIGAKILCNDNTVTAIRGQVFQVRAPWITNFYYSNYDTYVIPDGDLVTLGGCRMFDSWETTINKHMSADIWERCTEFIPSLKDAEVVQEWVGLRPFRPTVRIEKEIMSFSSGKSIRIIHNYGHGGYGVMSAPGTSQYAVELGLEMLTSEYTSKL